MKTAPPKRVRHTHTQRLDFELVLSAFYTDSETGGPLQALDRGMARSSRHAPTAGDSVSHATGRLERHRLDFGGPFRHQVGHDIERHEPPAALTDSLEQRCITGIRVASVTGLRGGGRGRFTAQNGQGRFKRRDRHDCRRARAAVSLFDGHVAMGGVPPVPLPVPPAQPSPLPGL
jgi:hypothetical protein